MTTMNPVQRFELHVTTIVVKRADGKYRRYKRNTKTRAERILAVAKNLEVKFGSNYIAYCQPDNLKYGLLVYFRKPNPRIMMLVSKPQHAQDYHRLFVNHPNVTHVEYYNLPNPKSALMRSCLKHDLDTNELYR